MNTLHTDTMSVHNFLISSYANSKDENDHRKLKDYLIKQANVSEGGREFKKVSLRDFSVCVFVLFKWWEINKLLF